MLHRQRQPSRERFGLRAFLCAAVTVFAFSLLFLVSNLPSPEPSFQSEQKPVAKPRDPETRQTAPIEEIREKPLVKDSSGTRTQVRTQAQAQELPQPHPSNALLPTIAEIRKNYAAAAAAATSGGEDDPCLIKHLGKSRNYSMFPVIVRIPKRAGYAYEEGCDVPCLYTSAKDFPYLDASVKLIPGGNAIPQDDHPAVCIKHHQKVMMSMESILNYPALKRKSLNAKGYNIQAIYDTNSDVPVPYFSWAEYDIYKKPVPKTADAMVAMFISNCRGSNGRLNYVKELMSYGVTVHSYGRCMHNKDAPAKSSNKAASKGEVIARYKFTIAMENGNTENYVTEKLYGPLVEGSVPIHMGVSNVHDFAPEHSVISVHDFSSAKELAEYLKELDRDDAKYSEYLAWKEKPPSDKFKALMDLSNVHSRCRLCIHLADKFSLSEYPPLDEVDGGAGVHYIRERGTFYFRPVELSEETFAELSAKALSTLRPGGLRKGKYDKLKVWDVYMAYNKTQKIKNDLDINNLPPRSRLEVVII